MRSDVEIMAHDIADLAAMLLGNQRYRNKRSIQALFKRIQHEAVIRPREVFQLAILAPDLVKQSAKALRGLENTYLLRAFSVLGQLAYMIGATAEAERSLLAGDSFRYEADPNEVVGLDLRWAALRMYQHRFSEALELANAAVEHLQISRGRFSERDDLSLACALVLRGSIFLNGHRHGEDYSAVAASRDFEEALKVSSNRTPQCRLSAIKNLGATAVWTWLTAEPNPLDPLRIANQTEWVRQEARRQRIPRRSLFDARARWIQAMAMAELSKGLSENANRLFKSALEDLQECGAPQDVAPLLLDYQWWLLHDNYWGRALSSHRQLETLADFLPETWRNLIAQWGEALKANSMTAGLVAQIFLEIRGIPGVISPVAKPVRWTGGW